jgi:hypothetical protein
MKKKKYLQTFFDKQLKKELEVFFGVGSFVKITNISYVRSKKSTLIILTLYVVDPNKIEDLFPTALEILLVRAWGVVGDGTNLVVQSSFDLVI